MALLFTIEQSRDVSRDDNTSKWPAQGCLVRAQATFVLGVQPDLGLIAPGPLSVALRATADRQLRTLRS